MPIGFSDHSIGNSAGIISVALGATVIEKHFTLDTNMEGPDHSSSLNPKEFKKFIEDIRKAETILGNEFKNIQKEEIQMRKISRKSAYLSRSILKSEVLSVDHLIFRRPGYGLYYKDAIKLLGKKSKKNMDIFELIRKKNFIK